MTPWHPDYSLQSKASITNVPGKARYSVIVCLIMVCSLNVSTASIDVNVLQRHKI